MKNTPLIICDEDVDYLNRLSAYIMKKDSSPFLIKTISDINRLNLEDFNEGLLLISSSLIREEILALDAHRLIILNESEIKRKYENFIVVNKFQPASAIYEKLLNCQMNREDIFCVNNRGDVYKEMKIYGVYSPIKRIGKSRYIKRKCEAYGEKQKILLISMEEFSKSDEEGAGLSEVIYFYKQNKFGMVFTMPGIIRKEMYYDYILPVRWVFDLMDMTDKDWVGLLEEIEKENIYDCVWIDFDGMPPGIELFEKCEQIYMPYIENAEETMRIKQFEHMLAMMPEFDIDEKLVKIKMEEDVLCT